MKRTDVAHIDRKSGMTQLPIRGRHFEMLIIDDPRSGTPLTDKEVNAIMRWYREYKVLVEKSNESS